MYSVETNGKHIVVINVPRADRSYRPVYIDGNPLNTYRRNGEGDCKCTHEEYQAVKKPFKLDGITRVDDTPVHQALREALANCLVNADYYGRHGVVIIKRPDIIILSNPGNLRIELSTALSGGVSDPRNSTMLKMFNSIDIGERAGSGIPNIFRVWKEQKWSAPTLIEEFDPDKQRHLDALMVCVDEQMQGPGIASELIS